MTENFEICRANGQYKKPVIDACFKELKRAWEMQVVVPLTPCQQLVLVMLQDEFEDFLRGFYE